MKDVDGKYVAATAKTEEELLWKAEDLRNEIMERIFHLNNPTLTEYTAEWLEEKKKTVKYTTAVNYDSIFKHIENSTLGSMYISDISPHDIKCMLANFSKSSHSVVKKLKMMLHGVFEEAYINRIISTNPYKDVIDFNCGIKTEEKDALTDDQVATLLNAVEGHRVHTFIAVAYYAGLRREEILGLKWDCVYIDSEFPHIDVQYTWHTEHNRGVVEKDTKTKKSERIVPIPPELVNILKESKEKYPSEYVVPNSQGGVLSGTQWSRLWKYVSTRTIEERAYYRYDKEGNRIKHTVKPVLGEKAKHNNTCIYSIDFKVTPHLLRHTCITNWIYAGADIKTVQDFAGHADPTTTLKIYAHVKNKDAESKYKAAEEIYKNLENKGILLYNNA